MVLNQAVMYFVQRIVKIPVRSTTRPTSQNQPNLPVLHRQNRKIGSNRQFVNNFVERNDRSAGHKHALCRDPAGSLETVLAAFLARLYYPADS